MVDKFVLVSLPVEYLKEDDIDQYFSSLHWTVNLKASIDLDIAIMVTYLADFAQGCLKHVLEIQFQVSNSYRKNRSTLGEVQFYKIQY